MNTRRSHQYANASMAQFVANAGIGIRVPVVESEER